MGTTPICIPKTKLKFQVEEFLHPNHGFKRLPPVYEVDGDEKAYTLMELDLTPALGGLAHRYQIIIVWRGDGKAQYIEDMGLAELMLAGPKSVQSAAFTDDKPADWVHSVAEVKEYANQIREIDINKLMGIEHEELNQEVFAGAVDEFFLNKNHVAVSGPLYSTSHERSGWSPTTKK